MSYIRCLSNPESLYVVGCEDIYWYFGYEGYAMPYEVFDGIMKAYDDEFEYTDPVAFQGAKLSFEKCGKDFKMILEYDGWRLEMWDVTFSYVFNDWQSRRWQYHARELWWAIKRGFSLYGIKRWIRNLKDA